MRRVPKAKLSLSQGGSPKAVKAPLLLETSNTLLLKRVSSLKCGFASRNSLISLKLC